jgi:DNA-binding transcriptional LysR family regulator
VGGINHADLVSFEIPLPLPPMKVSQAWHLRNDADPAHRWLRSIICDIASRLTAETSASAAPL